MGTAICKCSLSCKTAFENQSRKRPKSKRQLSYIVPVPRCADFVHFTGVTGRLSSCGLSMFQISTMANFETEVYELLKLFDSFRG